MRTVQWQGLSGDSTSQQEWTAQASARFQPARRLDGLVAYGTQRCPTYEFSWQLSATQEWLAERLDIRLIGLGAGRQRLNRTLLLERTDHGWRSTSWRYDGAALADPGLPPGEQPPAVVDAVIDACPLSHLAPIRRVGLAGPRPPARRGGPGRPLAVATPVLRVRLPSLTVSMTRHRYVWVEDAGPIRVLRHSFAGGAPTTITVDEHGVPEQFDGLVRRPVAAMVA